MAHSNNNSNISSIASNDAEELLKSKIFTELVSDPIDRSNIVNLISVYSRIYAIPIGKTASQIQAYTKGTILSRTAPLARQNTNSTSINNTSNVSTLPSPLPSDNNNTIIKQLSDGIDHILKDIAISETQICKYIVRLAITDESIMDVSLKELDLLRLSCLSQIENILVGRTYSNTINPVMTITVILRSANIGSYTLSNVAVISHLTTSKNVINIDYLQLLVEELIKQARTKILDGIIGNGNGNNINDNELPEIMSIDENKNHRSTANNNNNNDSFIGRFYNGVKKIARYATAADYKSSDENKISNSLNGSDDKDDDDDDLNELQTNGPKNQKKRKIDSVK